MPHNVYHYKEGEEHLAGLTHRQALFVVALVRNNFHRGHSAKQAGYKGSDRAMTSRGSENVAKRSVQKAIAGEISRQALAISWTSDRYSLSLDKLLQLAYDQGNVPAALNVLKEIGALHGLTDGVVDAGGLVINLYSDAAALDDPSGVEHPLIDVTPQIETG